MVARTVWYLIPKKWDCLCNKIIKRMIIKNISILPLHSYTIRTHPIDYTYVYNIYLFWIDSKYLLIQTIQQYFIDKIAYKLFVCGVCVW